MHPAFFPRCCTPTLALAATLLVLAVFALQLHPVVARPLPVPVPVSDGNAAIRGGVGLLDTGDEENVSLADEADDDTIHM